MTAPRRVAVLHRNLAFGGAEMVVVEQVRALAAWPCEVDVWATRRDEPMDLEGEIRAANGNVRRVDALGGTSAVAWRLVRGRYDVALTSIGRSPWRALRRLSRVPFFRRPAVIATLHTPHPQAVDPLLPHVGREVDLVALAYDFRAEAVKALGVLPSRLAVTRPLFSSLLLRPDDAARETARALRASWGATASSVVFGYLGRLAPEKGIPAVVRMAGRLAAGGRDVHLVLAGRQARSDAPDGLAFKAEIDAAVRDAPALRGRLHFPGAVVRSMGTAHFMAFDATVLCSSFEGLALMLWESLSVGTPIVSTGTGGIAVHFTDGVDAAIVAKRPDDGTPPSPDDLAAFEDRMRSLADDPDLRRRLGEAGQKRVAAIVATNDFPGDFRRAVEQAIDLRTKGRSG